MAGKLNERQSRFLEHVADMWVYRPHGAGAFRTADALVRRGLITFCEGDNRYGQYDTGAMLTDAGRAALASHEHGGEGNG